MKTLIIDNYDSFTYNLYQLVASINGTYPSVMMNDAMSYDDFLRIACDNIIISPGPGNPGCQKDFGLCAEVIKNSSKPILGVCLGHQGIAQVYSSHIIHSPKPMHGRVSTIKHQGHPLFHRIPESFNVVRYHSLMIDPFTLAPCFDVIAESEDGLIMAIAHKSKPLYGVQFHPESIASEYGKELIENFNALTRQFHKRSRKPIDPSPLKLHVKKIATAVDTSLLYHSLFSNSQYTVWLDSSLTEQGARFSFMGDRSGPRSYHINYDVENNVTTVRTLTNTEQIKISIFDYLERQLRAIKIEPNDLPFEFQGGFVGYLSYELKQLTLPIKNSKTLGHDAQFLFLDRFLAVDHDEQSVYIVCLDDQNISDDNRAWMNETEVLIHSLCNLKLPSVTVSEATRLALDELSQNVRKHLVCSEKDYIEAINLCKHLIREGESYEICLMNKIIKNIPQLNLLDYYQKLRVHNPAPYSAFLRWGDYSVACSSMERFLLISPEGQVETKPIKGTLPRTKDPVRDQQLAKALAQEERFFSENLMIVDLLRNDLGSVCEGGSVDVPKMMDVESYATVHQLVSTVCGKLKKGITPIECIKKMFPGGSITGAPKIRTVEMIDRIETEPRGLYTGSIGYLSLNHAVDLNIVIRTAVKQGDEVSIGIGGAIIDLSDPQEEFNEILLKAKALLAAFNLMGQSYC